MTELTTKDQAIAWYSQTPKKTRVTQINMDGEDGWMPLFPRPAPDCRTCTFFRAGPALHADQCYRSFEGCINGDQYKAAPAVVLWRTES